MPIYEYSCRRCHNSFEKLVLSKEETIKCPECGSGAAEKQLSVFSARSSGAPSSAAGGCACTPQTCGCH